MKSLVTLALLSLALAAPGTARANLLINGSLESGIAATQPDNLVYVSTITNSTALTGWTIDSGKVDIVPSSYFASSAGGWSVDLVGTAGIGSISQPVTTLAATQYVLTFDFSVNPEKGIMKNGVVVNEHADTKVLRVEAIGQDGTTVLGFQDFTAAAGTRTKTSMQYSQKTFTFTSDGTASTIRLLALTPLNLPNGLTSSTIYTGPVVDNLDLEVGGGGLPTPEPATLATLGMGAAALLMRRRARRA